LSTIGLPPGPAESLPGTIKSRQSAGKLKAFPSASDRLFYNLGAFPFREGTMGVLVCYDDFTYDVINDYHLDFLLGKGCIVGYDDSGDWSKTEDDEPGVILLTEVANEVGVGSEDSLKLR
jgi:hypothetical protein